MMGGATIDPRDLTGCEDLAGVGWHYGQRTPPWSPECPTTGHGRRRWEMARKAHALLSVQPGTIKDVARVLGISYAKAQRGFYQLTENYAGFVSDVGQGDAPGAPRLYVVTEAGRQMLDREGWPK
jgi:hypothetical protein